MAPALSQPLLLFCQAILLGMAAALLYDLLRAFRLRLPRLTSVFHRLLPVFAAGVGFLGGYPGIFAASDRHSPAGSGKFV